MKRSLVLISETADDLEFATEVASVNDLSFLQVKDCQEGRKSVDGLTHPLLFVNIPSEQSFSSFETEFRSLVEAKGSSICPNDIHLIGPENVDDLQSITHSPIFGHYVVQNYGDPKESGKYYGRVVQGLCSKSGFVLSNLISSQASIRVLKLQHSMEKKTVIDEIREYLKAETTFNERALPIIITAVDELIMNAIYDAPADETGEQELKSTARNMPIELLGKRSVELQMGCNGEYAAFTVIDRFGSLNKSKLLAHLFRTYTDDKLHFDDSVAGAGIGLATTFRTGGSLVFVHEPGKRTEVTVFFKQTKSFREFRGQFRFISIHVN